MIQSKIINKVSNILNIPADIVSFYYNLHWLFIREHIQSLPLKDNLRIDDFIKLRTNFNIPSLGKLYITLDRFINFKEQFCKYDKH